MTRIAVIGAAHWHVPLYEPGFAPAGVRLAGVWDPDPNAAAALAGRHGGTAYHRLQDLLDAGGIDVAFVFGTHAGMPALARMLIERRIPLSLEKPCGRNAAEVAGIRAAAEAAGVYVAVPLVQRVAAVGRHLARLAEADRPIDLSFRFIAGPPDRYDRVGCGWVLDPVQSGGGAAVNLAVHFIDLALMLTGSRAVSVFGRTSNLLHGRAVEDGALLSVLFENGAQATIEVGYRFPDAPPRREFRLSVVGREHYVESDRDGLVVRSRAGETRLPASFDTDAYYADYVARVVEDQALGRAPLTGLAEIEAALAVVDAAYASARTGDLSRHS